MFDASGKIQSGILLGNLVEFGSFKECIHIKYGEIKGKHCLLKITPTLDLIKQILAFRNVTERRFPKVRLIVEKSVLLWSICVPDSCPKNDILRHFNKTFIEMSEGLNLVVSLQDEHCVTLDSEPKMGLEQYISLYVYLQLALCSYYYCFSSVLAVFIVTVGVSTLLEAVLPSKNTLIASFSASSNYQKITARRTKNDLDCLHGLRFLSTCYVVVGHRYLMAMFSPVINGLEILDVIKSLSLLA